jgi:hypothetical protein
VQGVQQTETFMYLRVCKQNNWAFLSQARVSPAIPQMQPLSNTD